MYSLDESVFYFINHLDLGVFEQVAVQFRNKKTWIPLYVAVIIFIFLKNNWKTASVLVLCSFLCIGIGDQVSSQWIKKNVERPRPCHVDGGIANIDLKVRCGVGYSFTSSHATNHMALAVFWVLSVFRNKKWRYWFLVWAALVGMAQVYVGVHYPSDILAGFILGGLIGWSIHFLAKRIIGSRKFSGD